MNASIKLEVTTTIAVSTVHCDQMGGAIFTGQDESGRWIRAVASRKNIVRAPLRGEVWRLKGYFSRHQIYGVQLYITTSCLVLPKGRLLIRYLSTHPSLRGTGVGQVRAAKLYDKFGERLTSILDEGMVDELTDLLDEGIANKLIAAWQQHIKDASLIVFLDRHGVDARLAEKILHYWPMDAINKIKDNPYRLLALTDWEAVDRLARSLGIGEHDERRLIAAVEACVYQRLDTARDTLCNEETLRRGINNLLKCFDAQLIRKAINLALNDRAIVGDTQTGYQPFGCAVMEGYLMTRFEAMARGRENRQLSLLDSEGDTKVDAYISEFEHQEGMALNTEQRAAVRMATVNSLSILKGGAGVGKTTVLKAIHHVVETIGKSVVQMALAGRAAQRMREATGRKAYTIIGLLNQLRSKQLRIGRGDLIVIDESSMLDLILLYRLMRILPEGVRLLLVGDPSQLPPIGPGLIFHIMADSMSIPVQELIQVHRQAESTGIPDIAAQIRSGAVPDLPRFRGLAEGVSFQECDVKSVIHYLPSIVNSLGGFDEVQVLGVTKGGAAGVLNINQMFHDELTVAKPKLNGWNIAESDPVIFTKNNYDRDLYNGSLGRVEKLFVDRPSIGTKESFPRMICDFNGRKIEFTDDDIGDLELAYAITVHKAQGSQFNRVIIPIIKSKLLDRALIYTALTRGIKQVVFIGNKKAFTDAVVSFPVARLRNVGFSL
jgi:exodeoxyribonuclease V alpha subunit